MKHLKAGYYVDQWDDFVIAYPNGTFDVYVGWNETNWIQWSTSIAPWYIKTAYNLKYIGPL